MRIAVVFAMVCVAGCSVTRGAADWLYGSRLYRDDLLVKVIEDMQLYMTRRVELDPDMGRLRFAGRFEHPDDDLVMKWLRRLPEIYPIFVDDSNPRVVRIGCLVPRCAELALMVSQ